MKISIGRLRRLISEARYRVLGGAYRGDTGAFYSVGPIEMEADTPEAAEIKARDEFEKQGYSVDEISIEEIDPLDPWELSFYQPAVVVPDSALLLDLGINLLPTQVGRAIDRYDGEDDDYLRRVLEMIAEDIERRGWGLLLSMDPFAYDMFASTLYHPSHWVPSRSPHDHFAVEAGLGGALWLNPTSLEARRLVEDAIEILVNKYADEEPHPLDPIIWRERTVQSYIDSFGDARAYRVSAGNVYEAWIKSGGTAREAGTLGRKILGIS